MKDVREKNAMRAVRALVVAVLAFVVFAAPSIVLADGRVALVVGNSTYALPSYGLPSITATAYNTSLFSRGALRECP